MLYGLDTLLLLSKPGLPSLIDGEVEDEMPKCK